MKGLKLLKTFVSISQEGESPTTNSKKLDSIINDYYYNFFFSFCYDSYFFLEILNFF